MLSNHHFLESVLRTSLSLKYVAWMALAAMFTTASTFIGEEPYMQDILIAIFAHRKFIPAVVMCVPYMRTDG